MKKSDLKKLDKSELINLLVDVSKLNKENKAFLKSKLSSDFSNLFKLSCEKIDKAFFCFELMSLKDARQALNDFKKSNPDNELLIKLYLRYINCAYEVEKTDWRFQENFYLAIEKVYDMLFEIMKENNLLKEKYKTEVERLIRKANEGWGHRETLEEKYEEMQTNLDKVERKK